LLLMRSSWQHDDCTFSALADKLFAPFGALEGVKAVVQEHHGHEDAIAYVKFAVASDAAAAIEALNETTLPDGCLINVHVKRPSAKGKGKG
ncbi:unnamed protein product, partial [Prorocentrum cordatum]